MARRDTYLLGGLFSLMVIGGLMYFWQLTFGLGITGMSRDVSWGFYIAQFTYLVGVAASAVMVVLPYYLHNYKAFGRIAILGEYLAVVAVTMCLLFIVVDLGRPDRLFNIIKYPTPNSVLFWDMIVLNTYLFLNLLCGWGVMESERNEVPPPKWIKPTALLLYPVIIRLLNRLADLSEQLLDANLSTLALLGAVIAKRDSDTDAHNYRVTLYSLHLGEAVGLPFADMQALLKGAFLDDVGKIGIRDAVLLKPGRLTEEEFGVMRTHVDHGLEMVHRSAWLADAAHVVGSHHEKVDGSGYPHGKRWTRSR